MDTLSQIWKNDFGNYSHLFRQAFEHETIRRARKAGAQALNYTEIPSPRLSAILSGTPNQLRPLLVNRENGLASRFLPYMVEEIIPFDRRALQNGDHIEENSALNIFKELGKDLRKRWEWLASQPQDILWSLTDEQAEMLGDLFDDGYRLAMEAFHLPDSFDATLKRMAVTIKRIGAVLTVLRMEDPSVLRTAPLSMGAAENSEGQLIMYCSDDDFRTLVMLAEKLTRHAALMTLMLPEEKESALTTQVVSDAQERAEQLIESLGEKFTTQEAVEAGEALGMKKRSVMRYLSDACERKRIIKTNVGQYQKV
jgi:hypothetical protein